MGKAKTKGKDRTEDKYYKLAKQAGYRARSSFKLIHIDDKYNFLNSSRSILDLCAAPGGWMQIAVKRAPVGAFVLGVDLNPITKMLGAISIQEDITTPKCRATIKRLMQENGCRAFDLVLHDGSPNIGGRWAQEATEQNALVIEALRLATQFLAPKGDFITKIFRSQDYTAVIYCLSQLFGKVEPLKPDSSRKESAETFLIAKHYRAPAKVDPKLLDIKHLFQGGTETLKVVDVLREKKQKRHRDGYEDGVSTLRKVYSASKFVWSESPLDVLGSVTFISFDDPDSLSVKDHILTTEEVKALCDDLGVLGKQDFKHLLKWRMNIRKALSPAKQVVTENDGSKDEDKEDKDEDDDKVLNEMEELTYAMDRKKKREKQRIQKRLVKDKSRKATGMQIDALGDEYVDHELFSLAAIKGKKDLEAVDSTEVNDEKANMGYSSDEDTRETGFRQESSSDIDSDEEARRYDEQLEGFLDEAYERFINKRDGSSKQRKRAKRSFSEANKELMEGGDDGIVNADYDSDKDQGDKEANPLMVSIHEEEMPTQDEVTEQWFSQDIFIDAVKAKDLVKEESDDEMEDIKEEKIPKIAIPEKTLVKKTRDTVVSNLPKTQAFKSEQDFEIVPAPDTDSSDDSSSDESDLDDYEKAEVLACARRMLRKKQRDQIIDDGYNKYMFDDDNLPTWFIEEEKRHRQPTKPVTKEEINAMKAQFKEIDARPAKKVAQAKARKKRVTDRKLEKIRRKANTISDQTDIPEQSKGKMIEKLYKRAAPKRPKKEYVVAKKGVQVKAGKGKVLVDRRMKKDMRSNGSGRKGKGGSKGAKGGKDKKGAKSKGSSKPSARKGKMGNKGK